ncbi:MAG: hypothetical protein Q7T94_09175 [Rugosibacter sp.]|jgi:hypothetical protein|nr:hypothetical protein [Rugosibacter sp.]
MANHKPLINANDKVRELITIDGVRGAQKMPIKERITIRYPLSLISWKPIRNFRPYTICLLRDHDDLATSSAPTFRDEFSVDIKAMV